MARLHPAHGVVLAVILVAVAVVFVSSSTDVSHPPGEGAVSDYVVTWDPRGEHASGGILQLGPLGMPQLDS